MNETKEAQMLADTVILSPQPYFTMNDRYVVMVRNTDLAESDPAAFIDIEWLAWFESKYGDRYALVGSLVDAFESTGGELLWIGVLRQVR